MIKATWLGMGLALAVAAPAAKPAFAQPAARPARAARRPAKPPTTVSPADIAALSATDVEVAARAAEQLGRSTAPAAHEALLDALAIGLAPSVAAPAIVALAAHPAPPDLVALKRYASHHTPSVRIAALTSLASYPSPEAHAVIASGLRDNVGLVRTAAAGAAARGRVRLAIEPMTLLLAKGEDSSAKALAALADADLARNIAEQLGRVPDATLALCLGTILLRDDFGPETARVEVVRAIAKIQDPAAVAALTDYIDATAKNKSRASRQEAVLVVEARMGGK